MPRGWLHKAITEHLDAAYSVVGVGFADAVPLDSHDGAMHGMLREIALLIQRAPGHPGETLAQLFVCSEMHFSDFVDGRRHDRERECHSAQFAGHDGPQFS